MSEQRPGGQQATEPATPRKLRKAREQGDVARSADINAAAVISLGAALLLWTSFSIWIELRALAATAFGRASDEAFSLHTVLNLATTTWAKAALPWTLALAAVALVASFAQVGPLISLKPLAPQLQRLAPAANLKRIFGPQALADLLKALLKLGAFGAIVVATAWQWAPQIVSSLGLPPKRWFTVYGALFGTLAIRVCLLAAVLAAVDWWLQRHRFRKRHLMTREEVKREQKESEGDPQHKSERQRLHREILSEQALQRVAQADVVIINPTRIAVALKYDANDMDAPTVIARGQRLRAAKIRQLAQKYGVPIVRDVPLARALAELEVDTQIPTELYDAVAEVLRFVYELRQPNDPAASEQRLASGPADEA